MDNEDIRCLRTLIQRCVKMHQYRSAVFWADKLMNLSKGTLQGQGNLVDPIKDTLLLADVLINSSQYRRAIDLLTKNDNLRDSYYARFLVAQCYFKCDEFVEALNVLENLENLNQNPLNPTYYSLINFSNPDVHNDPVLLNSSVALLRGHVHEALNNLALAANCYKEAFRLDPFCFEALEKLMKLEALSDDDEKRISKLEFPGFSQVLACATKNIYLYKIPKDNLANISSEMEPLKNSVDVILAQAEYLLSINHYRKCLDLTSRILKDDPLNPECLPVHISVLKMLEKSNEKISWFATGSYYLCTHKTDLAKRHLRKATQEDRRFGPAWLALGHAYAADNEHDQAIAAYCTAAQIVRHSHVPMLYIGVEYSSSGNQMLAERFMQHALQRSPSDPAVLHELGTLALSLKRYNKALKLLKQAYYSISQLSGQVIAPFWEPLLNNLGHAYRELGHFEEALKMHNAALKLVENSPTTLETMGLIYAQMGRYGEAIRALQTALSLHTCRTDSTTAVDLLDVCVHRYARQLEVPLGLAPTANTAVATMVADSRGEEFEVGRDINESPPKERFQLLDCSLSMAPPSGIPTIKEDLDLFETVVSPPRKLAPSGALDSADDVSMEFD